MKRVVESNCAFELKRATSVSHNKSREDLIFSKLLQSIPESNVR